jgi:CRISPR-associated protein Cas1
LKWDTVIEQKAVELGRYLVGRTGRLDFSEPSPDLRKADDHELRRRILSLSQVGARRLGIGRSTLHYLRKNAKSTDSLRTYQKVSDKLKPPTVSTGAERVR